MPTISVIVPVYQVEDYLRRCIDSILAQTFRDFELILVDDGSPDHCPAICDEYAGRDSRIVVIHQKNAGLSAARNAGIDWVFANSDSEWISFVDSDDWVHPQFLELLYGAVNLRDECDVSVCMYEETDKQTVDFEKIKDRDSADIYPGVQIHNRGVEMVVAWNKLYRRKLFENVRYPIGKQHEDEFITYKLLFAARYVAVLPQKLYFYYQRADSIMGKEFSINRLFRNEAYLEREQFYLDHGLNDLAYSLSNSNEWNLEWVILEIGRSAQDKKIKKRAKQLYWKLIRISKPIWTRKHWAERCIFAVSPKLLTVLSKVRRFVLPNKES
ncbi:MAG: glycosyltransferase [Clostridiales bacterium]|nr:glycosyltransferase [Clostridiales bacterium]